jgi:hypothetical protein
MHNSNEQCLTFKKIYELFQNLPFLLFVDFLWETCPLCVPHIDLCLFEEQILFILE